MRLPELGVGVVWSSGLAPLLERDTALASMVEVEPQALWIATDDGYRARDGVLERLQALPQQALVHGVGFPLGGASRLDRPALALLRRFIDDLEAPWASEHLGFNEIVDARRGAARRGAATATGWLLPLRQSNEGIDRAATAIRSFALQLPVPFAIETGVSYLRPREDEIPDGAFFGAISEAADCGILLDLHNLYVNERNGRQPALEFISQIPLERVWEIHVAAGMEFEGYLLDSHSGLVQEPLLDLARLVVPLLPNLRALTFELESSTLKTIGLGGVSRQLEALGEIWNLRSGVQREPDRPSAVSFRRAATPAGPSPEEWETALGRLLLGRTPANDLERALSEDKGIALTRSLALEARAGMCIGAIPLTCRLIAVSAGPDGLWSLLEEHWATTPPQMFATREAEGFAAFLATRRPAIEYLDDVLAYERAMLVAQRTGVPQAAWLGHDPFELISALSEHRMPAAPACEPLLVHVPVLEPVAD